MYLKHTVKTKLYNIQFRTILYWYYVHLKISSIFFNNRYWWKSKFIMYGTFKFKFFKISLSVKLKYFSVIILKTCSNLKKRKSKRIFCVFKINKILKSHWKNQILKLLKWIPVFISTSVNTCVVRFMSEFLL